MNVSKIYILVEFIKIQKSLIFYPFQNMVFRHHEPRGYQKSSDKKNTPEMDELERDPIPLQFLASNFEKQKS